MSSSHHQSDVFPTMAAILGILDAFPSIYIFKFEFSLPTNRPRPYSVIYFKIVQDKSNI